MRIELFMKDLVSRKDIHDIATKLELNESSSRKLLKTAFPPPSLKVWKEFAEKVLLLGVVFILARIIFFFAYNWKSMGRFFKFAIVELLIIISSFITWKYGLNRNVGKASVTAGSILIGVLLALIGQTYQSGADTYELFITWGIIIYGKDLTSPQKPSIQLSRITSRGFQFFGIT